MTRSGSAFSAYPLGAVVELDIRDPDLLVRVRAMVGRGSVALNLEADSAEILITDRARSASGNRHSILLAAGPDAEEAMRAGAVAVLPAFVEDTELFAAVELVRRGYSVLPDDLRGLLRDGPGLESASQDEDYEPVLAPVTLTSRETEVLRLIADGASNKDVARSLGISVHTAKFHVASVLRKLDAKGRADALVRAVRAGLLML